MRFKQNQLVRFKDNATRMGRVCGFCHYEDEKGDYVHEGVLVRLNVGFYDPNNQTYVSILVCQADVLEDF